MAKRDRDDETGRYVTTYPEEVFLEAIEEADDLVGTQQIAAFVGCSYTLAYRRLRELEEKGSVSSKRVANARVWVANNE